MNYIAFVSEDFKKLVKETKCNCRVCKLIKKKLKEIKP